MKIARQYSPACERNREPILSVLRPRLNHAKRVLEIASGTGMHAAHFAPALPHVHWQPTDRQPEALESIEAWRLATVAPNLAPAIELDVCAEGWNVPTVDAVFCANMVHIAPWEACLGLLRGAAQVLTSGGMLFLYGPFKVKGQMAASNEAFDRSLRQRDPRWGVRDLEDVIAEASQRGLVHEERVCLPANNELQVFRRVGGE